MLAALTTYQLDPSPETLGQFWCAIQPLVRGVTYTALENLGRLGDGALFDAALAEMGFRVSKMAGSLRTLQVENERALAAYLQVVARGAALTAADNPVCGPTRRNAKRQAIPTAPLKRTSWPRDGSSRTVLGSEIPDTRKKVYLPCTGDTVEVPGTGRAASYDYTDHDVAREPAAPLWMTAVDRGDEWQRFVTWIVATAREIATGDEAIAVEQILEGETDRKVAAKLKIGKTTWQERRAKLLAGLAARIAVAADYEMDELGEKYLGESWITAANRAWAAVVSRERERVT